MESFFFVTDTDVYDVKMYLYFFKTMIKLFLFIFFFVDFPSKFSLFKKHMVKPLRYCFKNVGKKCIKIKSNKGKKKKSLHKYEKGGKIEFDFNK